jgi:citrate lyase subunit beta/citryl-CoA lyase
MLFVPGDSEKKLASAASVRADALVLDLEDSVAPARKAHARALVTELLSGRRERNRSLWVRVNPFDTPECRDDLAAVMQGRPDGVVLPKPRSAADVVELGVWLDGLEQRCGIAPGETRVLPIVTETPAAVLALASYLTGARRLAALTWGAEDLSVALGATTNVDEHGAWLPPFELARSGCLLAAAGAGVPAIDTVYTNLRDLAGLERQAAAARRDGFSGKLAVHPEQVEILNGVFRPTADETLYARRVIAAFAAADTGVVVVDGRMLDRPHLLRAQRVVELAARLDGAAP